MGTYTRPDKVVVATGAAVYEGIQKGLSNALGFLEKEAEIKTKVIEDSIVALQKFDNDVNSMASSGDTGFDDQIITEAQIQKEKLNNAYKVLGETFATGADKAAAKKVILESKQYTNNLVADMSTTKYITSSYREALQNKQGAKGSVSLTNDVNILKVAQDLSINGGASTTIETQPNGQRVLVTKSIDADGKETDYRLNISGISAGMKADPNYQLFKSSADISDTVDTAKNAITPENGDFASLVASGLYNETARISASGERIAKYELNREKALELIKSSGIGSELANQPSNYNYANSLWMDHMGNKTPFPVDEKDKQAALSKVQNFLLDQAIAKGRKQFGFGVKLAKPEKRGGERLHTDWDQRLLDLNAGNVNFVQAPERKGGEWLIEEDAPEGKEPSGEKANMFIRRYKTIEVGGEMKQQLIETIPLYKKVGEKIVTLGGEETAIPIYELNKTGWRTANNAITKKLR